MNYIETENLILRNYKRSDMKDYWEYASQPNVGPRCGWQPHTQKKTALERLIYETKRPFQFAIELKDSHKVIGSIELDDTRPSMIKALTCKPEETREIGCLLNENYWGKGIMTQAMKAIIKYGFDYMGLKVITASYFEPNIGSGKIQAKCGLKPFLREKDSFVWYETGKKCDAIDCKITKEEYDQIPEYKTLQIKVGTGTKSVLDNKLKQKYNEQKAAYAYKLYCENKPFVKVYSVVQKGDKFLVLENYNKKYKYSLAGGGVEEGEDIETATKREVLEELNVRVRFIKELDVIHYVRTWTYQGKPFDVNYEAHIVLSEVVATGSRKKRYGLPGEFDKEMQVLEISKEEMLENVAEFVTFKVKF